MKWTLSFLLFIVLQPTANAQGNPSDVSVFYRVEAIAMGIELFYYDMDAGIFDLEPQWLEAHQPSRFDIYQADDSGIIQPGLGSMFFERDSDCRIKEIRFVPAVFSDWTYKILFDYDLVNRKISMTTLDRNDASGPGEYYWRFTFSYDSEENITRMERFFYEEPSNDFVLNAIWDFTQFDNCGNYGNLNAGEIGLPMTNLNLQRNYGLGDCRQQSTVFTNTNGNTLYKTIHWEYDSNARLASVKSEGNNFCEKLKFDYDQAGRRIGRTDGDCDTPDTGPSTAYGWNADNSLAWLDFEPSLTDTFTRILIEYNNCGNVPIHDLTEQPSVIRLKNPVQSGERVPVFGLEEKGIAVWELKDSQGRMIRTGTASTEDSTLLIPESLPAGLYMLHFRAANLTQTIRLLIH